MRHTKINASISGFSLIEILVGILIVSIVMVAGFQALSAVGIGRVKLFEEMNIEKEAFYFSEKLFAEIKAGGVLDYEEYFNRQAVGAVSYSSGHYDERTGFGNFGRGGNVGTTSYGDGFYYCRSDNGTSMGTGGCLSDNRFNSVDNQVGEPQRFGQYSFQFIDYNINADADLGDENGDGKIIGDQDDENLGEGPRAFTGGQNVQELYLISGDNTTRTFFRWQVQDDPDAPASAPCNYGDGSNPTGDGCRGTIQILKLVGKDLGVNHDGSSQGAFDGLIDTWMVHPDFSTASVIAESDANSYWVDLFSDRINVKDVKFFLSPEVDTTLAWKDTSSAANIAPYIRLQLTVMPSWQARKQIKGTMPEMTLSTTISLTPIYSQ